MNILTLVRAGKMARRGFRRWRERARAKKKAKGQNKETPMLKGKLTYTMIAALAVQLVAGWLGVDIAPPEVDAIVGALSVLGAVYGRWRATR